MSKSKLDSLKKKPSTKNAIPIIGIIFVVVAISLIETGFAYLLGLLSSAREEKTEKGRFDEHSRVEAL